LNSIRLIGALLSAFLFGAVSAAETINYQYDALGRLISETKSDGVQTSYTLDAAGNRVQVATSGPPGIPPSINVPSSSSGSYTISWGASTSGVVTAYELYESTAASFSPQTLAYSGTGTSRAVSGKPNGTYYYRVRACNGAACSGYRAGANPVTVLFVPSMPPSISVPSTSLGSYTIGWGASTSGGVTAYELYESAAASFSPQTLAYSGTGTSLAVSGKPNGTYYYRVRACSGSTCSGYLAGANPVAVQMPSAPPSITVPATSTGSYSISWSASTSGVVTAYELYESTVAGFSPQTLAYSGTGTSLAVSSKPNGTYYYRVRACNGSTCTGYLAGANPVVVQTPVALTLDDASAYGEASLGTMSVSYGLASNGVVMFGASGNVSLTQPAHPYWITPQSGMNLYQAKATSGCPFKNGTYGTWQALGAGSTPTWGVSLTPNKTAICAITVQISAIANPSVILDSATINLELYTVP